MSKSKPKAKYTKPLTKKTSVKTTPKTKTVKKKRVGSAKQKGDYTYKEEDFLKAIAKGEGNIKSIREILGCSRLTVINRIKIITDITQTNISDEIRKGMIAKILSPSPAF